MPHWFPTIAQISGKVGHNEVDYTFNAQLMPLNGTAKPMLCFIMTTLYHLIHSMFFRNFSIDFDQKKMNTNSHNIPFFVWIFF